MKKHQISLLAASILPLLITSTACLAEESTTSYKGSYKDEAMVPCPILTLHDGLYIGAAVGYDSYRVAMQVPENGLFVEPFDADIGYSLDPVINSTGIVGGILGGYGKYFGKTFFGTKPYLGVEVFVNASSAQADHELTLTNGPETHQLNTSIKENNNYGIGLIPGLRINNTTLLYARVGYNWSQISIDEDIFDSGITNPLLNPIESEDTLLTRGGLSYGLGVETTFYENLSLRAEYTHTDYQSFESSFDSQLKENDNQFMLSVIYHFNFEEIFADTKI